MTTLRIGWLLAILGGVAAIAYAGPSSDSQVRTKDAVPTRQNEIEVLTLGDGGRGIADAGGHIVPLRDYRRIASGSTIADELLLAMAEPERIAVLTDNGREHSRMPPLYGARRTLHGPSDVEGLREHRIDLYILNHYGAPAELARARETGSQVFNLGDMRGLTTLESNIEAIALLLGDRSRGTRLLADFERRFRAVAADIPRERRKRALYLSAYGGQLLGGTRNTSYYDVLTAAGLIDVAAEHYRDWPKYDPEELLRLDPDLIITTEGSASQLCRVSSLDRLRACAQPRGVLPFPDPLLSNPGLGMLHAAEQLRERVYGPLRAP